MRWVTLSLISSAIAMVTAAAQPAAPRVRLVEELRLDATTEDFPSVTRVFVGPDGRIVVPINADMHLRVYDTSGKKIGVVGRRGSGPGEFNSVSLVGWAADTMWVGDVRQYRTSFFAPDLTLLRTTAWSQSPTPINDAERLGYFYPAAILPDGSAIGEGLIMPTGTERGPSRGSATVRRSSSGALTLLARRPPDEEAPWMMWVSGLGQLVPFALQPQRVFDARRFAELTAPIPTSQDGTFNVTVISTTGDTVYSRRYPFRGVLIPRAAKDSAAASFLGRRTEGPADTPRRFQAMAHERMSSWYIPVETIMLGHDRTVWIGMRPAAEGRPYLVLNAAGDPVGTVTVPRSTRVRQARADRIWVTETDDDGLSSVVRYRVIGLQCGRPGC